MSEFSTPVDSEEAYEADKNLLVLPENLRIAGAYTLRLKWPPSAQSSTTDMESTRKLPFATDMESTVELVAPNERPGLYNVEALINSKENKPLFGMSLVVSSIGYVVLRFNGGPELDDMGYFFGSGQTEDMVDAAIARMLEEPVPNLASVN